MSASWRGARPEADLGVERARAPRTCGSARTARTARPSRPRRRASKQGSSTTTGAGTAGTLTGRTGSAGSARGPEAAVASAVVNGRRVRDGLPGRAHLRAHAGVGRRALAAGAGAEHRLVRPRRRPGARPSRRPRRARGDDRRRAVQPRRRHRPAARRAAEGRGRVRTDARREHPHHVGTGRVGRARDVRRCARRGAQPNRIAHDQVVRVLEGKGQVVTTRERRGRDRHRRARGRRAARARRQRDPPVRLRPDERARPAVRPVPVDRPHARATGDARCSTTLATWLPIATVAVGAGAIVGCDPAPAHGRVPRRRHRGRDGVDRHRRRGRPRATTSPASAPRTARSRPRRSTHWSSPLRAWTRLALRGRARGLRRRCGSPAPARSSRRERQAAVARRSS